MCFAVLLALGACKQKETAPAVSTTRPTTPPVTTSAAPAAGSSGVAPVLASGGLDPKRTHVLIVGVLQFANPNVGQFATRNRKDQELADLFISLGVPRANVTTLLDRNATAAAVFEALKSTVARVGPGDTLVFYYAGHGSRAKDGTTTLLSYDDAGLKISALEQELNRLKQGRAVLLADCCYSGSLGELADRLTKTGVKAASVTSAAASNLSTGNWTYTQTLIDVLRGDPLADQDSDGTLTLGELSAEVREAMKFREQQRHGAWLAGLGEAFPLTKARGKRSTSTESFPPGAYVLAPQQPAKFRPARVMSVAGAKRTVRFFDYSDSTDVTVEASVLKKLEFRRFDVGKAVEVFWSGKLWPAKIKKREGDFHFITYPGWPAYWDEWVTSSRIVEAADKSTDLTGRAVQIEWRGAWYPGKVLRQRGHRYLVHYDGFGGEWNEWAPASRVRAK